MSKETTIGYFWVHTDPHCPLPLTVTLPDGATDEQILGATNWLERLDSHPSVVRTHIRRGKKVKA